MKTEIVLAKFWIQTSKNDTGNRFDQFLKFFLKGGRVYNFEFFWRGRILFKKLFFLQNVYEMGRREAPWAHIRR